jgi:cytochrome P450
MEQDAERDSEALERRFASFSTYDAAPKAAFDLIEDARGRCPVAQSGRLGGFKLLLDYEDVRRAALDWRGFSSQPSAFRPIVERPALAIDSDPPTHALRRGIISMVVNEQTPARIEAAVCEDIDALLDSLEAKETCDLVADFAEQVPLRAICHIFGFSVDQGPEIRLLSVQQLASKADPERAAAASRAFRDFAVAAVLERRGGEGDDMLTRIANAELEGRRLDSDQIAGLLIGLLTAGHDTTVSGLTSLLYETLRRPELRDRLAAQPGLIKPAVEEALRLNPPVFGLYRRATRDTQVARVEIREDESVYLCWAAANRDPQVFDDPDAFRLDRSGKRH